MFCKLAALSFCILICKVRFSFFFMFVIFCPLIIAILGILVAVKWYPIVSLMTDDIEHLFHVLSIYLCIFGKMSIQIIYPCFSCIVVMLSCKSSFYILDKCFQGFFSMNCEFFNVKLTTIYSIPNKYLMRMIIV